MTLVAHRDEPQDWNASNIPHPSITGKDLGTIQDTRFNIHVRNPCFESVALQRDSLNNMEIGNTLVYLMQNP